MRYMYVVCMCVCCEKRAYTASLCIMYAVDIYSAFVYYYVCFLGGGESN